MNLVKALTNRTYVREYMLYGFQRKTMMSHLGRSRIISIGPRDMLEILKLYDDGRSVHEISLTLPYSHTSIVTFMEAYGHSRRARSQLGRPKRPFTAEDADRISDIDFMYSMGMSQQEIANSLGLHQTTISSYMRKYGIRSRCNR